MQLAIGLFLSALIGLSLGIIGGGGSIITIPILVYVIGVEPYSAVPMSLAVVGVTSVVGAVMHRRRGHFRLEIAMGFGGAGILGAFFGSRLTYLVSQYLLLLIFAGLMIVVVSMMFFRRERKEQGDGRPHPVKAAGSGLVVGILTGFLGVGGGFLIVPSLMLFARLGIRDAIGTSLAVIAINCASGIAGHLRHGGFDLQLAGIIALPAMLGAIVGTKVSIGIAPDNLRRGFALFALAVAAYLVYRNLGPAIGR